MEPWKRALSTYTKINNLGPFVATISIAWLVTVYMVLVPAHWVEKLMQLTAISWDFKLTIVALGLVYLAVAWAGEHYVFNRVAGVIGRARQVATGKSSKRRKQYKAIKERMRF